MNPHLRNTVSALLLFFYAGAGILVELTHHDTVAFPLQSHPTFEQHNCDAYEKHISPEADHCLACTHVTHRVATEAHWFLPPQPLDVAHRRIFTVIEQTLESDVYHSGKRGPPTHIA